MSFERIKKIGKYQYRYIVKSVRIGGKVRQTILQNLGKVLDQSDEAKELKKCSAKNLETKEEAEELKKCSAKKCGENI